MKTRFNHTLLFALVSFFLLAGNVNAEGTERTDASSLEIIDEPELELEAWMVNENYWAYSALNNFQYETELMVEDWMVNESNWENLAFDNQNEEAMNVEDWMINDPFFADETINKAESELGVESWMIDANFWDFR